MGGSGGGVEQGKRNSIRKVVVGTERGDIRWEVKGGEGGRDGEENGMRWRAVDAC